MLKPFESTVFQLFLDLIRAGGTQPNAKQLDTLRGASLNFSRAFKAQVLVECMDLLNEFQGNVKEALEELERKLEALESKKNEQVPGVRTSSQVHGSGS